jgi:carboxymethylenebutenolidase
MAHQQRTSYEGLLAETVTVEGGGGDRIPAYLARPLADAPRPAVIVLHHRAGWDWASKEIVRRLAAEGFVAIMPHLHHRHAPGDPPEVAAAAALQEGGIADAQVLGDSIGTKTFIESQPYTTGRVGIIGYCSGGRQAYMVACSTTMHATVVCYGGRIVASEDQLSERMPVAAIDMTESLSGPVLGLFGRHDTKPSPEDVAKLSSELERHKKTFRFRTYDDAGHAFFAVDRDTYRPDAAAKGWSEVFEWFSEHL